MANFVTPNRSTVPPVNTPAASPVATTVTRSNPTVLTTDCEFKGALAFGGELQLHGRVEGTIESEGGTLIIGEEALVKAEIKVNDVIVYGKLQGNISATGRIDLKGKAVVHGDLRANRVAIEDGVIFVGRSETLTGKNIAPEEFSKLFSKIGTSRPGTTSSTSAPSSSSNSSVSSSSASV